MPLTFAPRTRPATGLEVGQDRLLPGVKTLAVHVASRGARFVVTGDPHGIPQVV